MTSEPDRQPPTDRRRSRWMPLLILATLTAVALTVCWFNSLSFKTIGLNYEWLRAAVASNLQVWVLIYVGAYVAMVALSLPGALLLTLTGGLLLGWHIGAPATVIGATAGATVVFLVARSSFGVAAATKLEGWLENLRQGFQDNALSYLLFLRLVPVFPFVVVNLAAAILGVPLRTYILGTFLGIIPASTAYSMIGAGLGSAIDVQNRSYHACLARMSGSGVTDCPYVLKIKDLVPNELILGLVLLGVVALVPVALKKWRLRNATA
jgi:uncharacterized membrane protein YdjX (TVP38/TMEM64 family)